MRAPQRSVFGAFHGDFLYVYRVHLQRRFLQAIQPVWLCVGVYREWDSQSCGWRIPCRVGPILEWRGELSDLFQFVQNEDVNYPWCYSCKPRRVMANYTTYSLPIWHR